MKINLKTLMRYAGALAMAAVMPLAHAASVPVPNGDFEGGNSPWTFAPAAGVSIVLGGRAAGGSTDSTNGHALQFKSFVADKALHSDGSATQDNPFTQILLDGTYLFNFWAKGDLSALAFLTASITDPLGPTKVNLPFIQVPFIQGSVLGEWTQYSSSGLILSADFDTFQFLLNPVRNPFQVSIDDISFTACDPGASCTPNGNGNVPEPGSLFLVGAALAAGAVVRRKVKT